MKRNRNQEKRVKKLILTTGLFAVLLVASTYAWFIGMEKVAVSAFDVKIKAIDGLALSIDGDKFGEEVTINKANYNTVFTTNNQNVWGDLIPMSSMGIVNNTTSKLVLYEKASLTATDGGYRIMASQVQNTASKEGEGYVAFDLFIKNLSGKEYYTTYNELNEEAIYLTTDSKVEVATNGGSGATNPEEMVGTAGTGIENSVRVGFAQIARVKADVTDQDTITGLSCQGGTGVTVICNNRVAQIWEPNDTKHTQNAINWYNKSCKARTAAAVWSGACGTVADDTAYPTYAISTVIDDNVTSVDVYDGAVYNGYTGSSTYLSSYNYFTDTEKDYTGESRPAFMTLAPNSITKVRVYVWIEGQDIDNYDFAQLGQAITVNFGFTKEKFTGTDVNYSPSGTATLPEDVR